MRKTQERAITPKPRRMPNFVSRLLVFASNECLKSSSPVPSNPSKPKYSISDFKLNSIIFQLQSYDNDWRYSLVLVWTLPNVHKTLSMKNMMKWGNRFLKTVWKCGRLFKELYSISVIWKILVKFCLDNFQCSKKVSKQIFLKIVYKKKME